MPKNRTEGPGRRPAAVEEDPFIQAVLASPDDPAVRLVYADWLEERGDPRGEFLRLEMTLMGLPREDARWPALAARVRELRATIDRDWLTALSRSPIELCEGTLVEFQCPKRWDRLSLTPDVAVRWCDACRKEVYYCRTIGDAMHHALLGRCVAVDAGVTRRAGDLTRVDDFVGLLDVPIKSPRQSLPPPPRRPRWWRFWRR